MDLIRIYKETTIFGLAVFCFGYFKCAGDKRYTLIYMCFQFFNLLTSHSIYGAFNWILVFLTIGSITYYSNEDSYIVKRLWKRKNNKNINNE